MSRIRSRQFQVALLSLVSAGLCACTTVAPDLADGESLRTLIVSQTDDKSASTRYGTVTPQGTDPEVANTAVRGLRSRGGGTSSKPSLFDVLLGGTASK
jgi:hypothetical protein